MNKYLKISLIVIGVILLSFLIWLLSNVDKPFNKVELSDNNLILVPTNLQPYDTILSVGLDEIGISGLMINVSNLSESTKNNFEGDLKAHLRYHQGVYYLFIDELSNEEAIRVISHEIIHINQYHSKDLIYENGLIVWKGDTLELNSIVYDNRPWEIEAYDHQADLSNKISKKLYNE